MENENQIKPGRSFIHNKMFTFPIDEEEKKKQQKKKQKSYELQTFVVITLSLLILAYIFYFSN